MSEKHQCEGRVRYGDWGRSRPCTKTGAYEHEGKHYCKTHHPPSIKERDAARHDAWKAKWDAEKKQRDAADAKTNEQKRRAECFPDLFAALQLVRMSAGWQVLSKESRQVIDAAIAKAEGQQ